jgi:hypothetical protein
MSSSPKFILSSHAALKSYVEIPDPHLLGSQHASDMQITEMENVRKKGLWHVSEELQCISLCFPSFIR